MATATARPSRTNGNGAARRRRVVDAGEVAKVAYELFEQRGRVHGFDRQDWFTAEQIVAQRQPR